MLLIEHGVYTVKLTLSVMNCKSIIITLKLPYFIWNII